MHADIQTDGELLNWDVIAQIKALVPAAEQSAFFAEIVGLFLDGAPDLMQGMTKAVERGEPRGLVLAAHKFKGSCLYMGAWRMASICRELETNGHLHRIPQLAAQKVAQLEIAFAQTKLALEDCIEARLRLKRVV